MPYLLLIISAILASCGQLFLKKSAVSFSSIDQTNIIQYFIHLLTGLYSWLGVISYGLSFAVYMVALNKVELSVAKSFNALSYILVIILSVILFKDGITIFKVTGFVLIAFGLVFIGLSK